MAQDLAQLADSQVFILKALAAYRFLTVKQMLELDYQISRTQLYTKLKPMKDETKPLIKFIDFGSLPGKGRLDIVFFLSPRGASVLQELGLEPEQINFPKRVRAFNSEYHHRMASVGFHITVDSWCKANKGKLELYESYYDDGKKAPNGKALQKTTITQKGLNFSPDSIFNFTTVDGVKRLCCFELHNGDEGGRIMKQIEVYCQALHQRVIEDSYSYPHSARVLIVFENEKCLQKTRVLFVKRDDLKAYSPNFFLKTKDEIQEGDFKLGWRKLNNNDERLSLF